MSGDNLYQSLTPELWNYVTEGLDGEEDQKQVVQEIYPAEAKLRFQQQLAHKKALQAAWANCFQGEHPFSDIKTLAELVNKCQYDSWLPAGLYLFGRDDQTAQKIETWLAQLCTLPRLLQNLRQVTIQRIRLPRALVENLTGVFELRLSEINILAEEAADSPLVLRAPHCTRLKLERTTTLLKTEIYVSGACKVHLFKVSSPEISVSWHCRSQVSSLYAEKCHAVFQVQLKNIQRQNVQNLDHCNLRID